MSPPQLVVVGIFRGAEARPEQKVVARFAAPQVAFETKQCCTLRDDKGEFIASICWPPEFNARRVGP